MMHTGVALPLKSQYMRQPVFLWELKKAERVEGGSIMYVYTPNIVYVCVYLLYIYIYMYILWKCESRSARISLRIGSSCSRHGIH